jgi:hypothetical protein
MKPNHHYVVHLPAQIRDYGPVYGFWCFLGERLNKILKSFKSNNWGGGQLEVSMVREWGRDVQLHEMVRGGFGDDSLMITDHEGKHTDAIGF